MLVDGDVCAAAAVEPGRIKDVAAVLGLVPGVGKQHMGQIVAGILQHVAHVALALVIEETVGRRVNIAQILGAEGLDNVTRLIVEFHKVIRMALQLDADALALDDRQQFLHGFVEHAVADLLLVGVARELGVDDRYAHVDCDLNDALPVGDRVLALLLGRAGPAVNHDEGRNLHAGLLERLLVFRLALLGEQRVLIERIDARMRGLLDIFVAPVRYLVHVVVDRHLLGQYVNVKCDFHIVLLLTRMVLRGALPFDGPIIPPASRAANDTTR